MLELMDKKRKFNSTLYREFAKRKRTKKVQNNVAHEPNA